MSVTTKDVSPPPTRNLPLNLAQAAQTLESSAAKTNLGQDEREIMASAAKTIADGLKNLELRTSLGRETNALQAIGKLMLESLGSSSVSVKMELCRVVGNACFDHDENRQIVLDSNIPLLISKIIDSVTQGQGEASTGRKALTVEELKTLRACIGAILNSSLKFDPIQRELSQPAILRSLLSLIDNRPTSTSAKPVYFVGMHLSTEDPDRDWEEKVDLGETIAGWTMNVLEDVLSEDNSQFPSEEGIPILASILLSVPVSRSSSPTSHDLISPSLDKLSLDSHSAEEDEDDDDSHLDTCIELLSISAALLEGLTLDHSIHKQTISLSSYPTTDDHDSSLLHRLLDFVEFAAPPKEWTKTREEEKRLAKTFEVVKAATVRAVVEGMNDDRVMHELWKIGRDETRGEVKKNRLVEKLVGWLKRETERPEGVNKREDLTVCASHMLAGLGRSDQYVERLVHEYGLASPLAKIIEARVPAALVPATSTPTSGQPGQSRAGENTQILYGVVSLMRHLAIPLKNRPIVSSTHIIPTISRLLSPSLDIVKPLQMSVVGLLKHLTNLNVSSSLDILALPPTSSENQEPPLDLILALIKRTDELQLRSESTRILINLVRSLFSTSDSTSSHLNQQDPTESGRFAIVSNGEVVSAISEQVRLSEKYPVLVNEGIVALSLLAGSGGEQGASTVLSSLLHDQTLSSTQTTATTTEEDDNSPSKTIATRGPPKRTASLSLSPSGDPPTSLDMLLIYLSSVSTTTISSEQASTGSTNTIRPEMVSNACTLLITVIKRSPSSEDRENLCGRLRGPVKDVDRDVEDKTGEEWGGVKQAIKVLVKVLEEAE
ncbi:hypothetical protein JCM16303_006965 [Sporobolomyces ruberrimus]